VIAEVRVLYVAADGDRCAEAAREIAAIDDGVEVAGATNLGGVRTAFAEDRIDCLVFAENPLTAEGARLDRVAALCRHGDDPVPIVLFTDDTYGPTTAKATEAVADYVNAEAEDAFEHLVDRIRWNTTAEAEAADDRYERMVESMDEGVIVFEPTGRIGYANEAMVDVFGLGGDPKGIGLDVLADNGVFSPEDADAVRSAVGAVLDGEADVRTPEVTVAPADGGDRRIVEFGVVPFPGGAGGALATARNVTEYKQAEHALASTRSKIERLHGVTDRMGACRSETELFEQATEALQRVLAPDVCGVDAVEDDRLVPKAVRGADYDATPADDGVGGRAIETGTSILVEDVDEGARASPVPGARSTLCVPVDGVALLRAAATDPDAFHERDRDLAELLAAHVGEALTRIRVGRTLRERERDLAAERERLVGLFENVPHPVVSYVVEGGRPVVGDANPSFEGTFGVDADAALGDPLREHVRPPDGGGPDAADLDERLRSGERVETTVRRETPDGVRDFLLHAGPLEDRPDEGYAVYTDITPQKRRERELERRTDRLDRIGEVVEEELVDRLNEARGYLELVAETGDPDDVDTVRAAHEDVGRLLGDVRDLARRDLPVDPEPQGLERAATRAWASVETGAATLEAEDEPLVADPDRLEELLERLFRNSVAHGSPGTLPGEGAGGDGRAGLTVGVGPLDDREGFFVADDGVGIPPERRERVFRSGFSTADGSGLGLSVVERIAEAHGWSVELVESDGGGTRFEFDASTADHPRAERGR
jgi:PAS domain S-box-containing protein